VQRVITCKLHSDTDGHITSTQNRVAHYIRVFRWTQVYCRGVVKKGDRRWWTFCRRIKRAACKHGHNWTNFKPLKPVNLIYWWICVAWARYAGRSYGRFGIVGVYPGSQTLLQTRHVYRQSCTGQPYAGGCVRWYWGKSVQGLVDVAESVVCQVYGILVHAVR
jgi:hypothetical protein